MSKQYTSTLNGGAPIYYTDLKDIADVEIQNAVSILKGNTNGQAIIVNGCTVSNINTTTQTLTISSGEIYLNGIILSFTGYTG